MGKDNEQQIGQASEDELVNRPTLKELLQKVTFGHKRAIEDSVVEIELGPLGEEADKLLRTSLADPEGREVGSLIILTPQRRLFIQTNPVQGSQSEVIHRLMIKRHRFPTSVPKEQRQNIFLGSGLHTHGNTSDPISAVDLSNLLLSDYDSSAETAAFVINTEEKVVVFRGSNSPLLTSREVAILEARWDNAFVQRCQRFVSPYFSQKQREELRNKISRALSRDIMRKYDLRYFSCPVGENIVRRAQIDK